MNKRLTLFAVGGTLFLIPLVGHAQPKPHGEFKYWRNGMHSGNQIRTSFYNDGFVGRSTKNPQDIGGEWPINSGHTYVGDACLLVGAEVKDKYGATKHIVVTPIGPEADVRTGQKGPEGDWYTFQPLPGYFNPDTNKVAMSQWKWSWPAYWPDKMEDVVDPGWPKSWNGYFGKNVFNADQESYFVMDDYNDREFAFYPDTTDTLRRGLGMQVAVRGFQWSNALVEDAIFWLFDITNVGTTHYDKVIFGQMVGNMMGNTASIQGDFNDDNASYDLKEDLAYSWDNDGIGAGNWKGVGWLGYAFLESPGNAYDGIDNDGDGAMGSGPIISEEMFAPRTLQAGDAIVLINYQTYERTVSQMPNDTLRIQYRDRVIKLFPGQIVTEVPQNLIDDNLNGLIDENNGSRIEVEAGRYEDVYLNVGLKYINYITGDGKGNILIEERRDDGIDNDRDWDPVTDDVGLDGVANTHDPGEGDGRPTSGRGTNLPGEPHIDKTDIDESDQIGLTSFFFFYPFNYVPLADDEKIWLYNQPGYLNAAIKNKDADFMFGSGYFPMKAGQTERFSMAMIFGDNQDDLLRNKKWVSKAYGENYNFAKAPYVPTLTAVPGNNRVTLYWDSLAETSVDPISGKDFEGYRIYRSTDPGFSDMTAITDAFGSTKYLKPLAQFDLVNEYEGFAAIPIEGVHFWLGENTGLRHSWVDTTALNGYTYYYAVTSYDHGDPALGIPPSECTRYISISTAGEVDKGKNVAICRPEAPAAGYKPASLGDIQLVQGRTTGTISYEIIDPALIVERQLDGHKYRVTFQDTLIKSEVSIDTLTTKNYTLTDVTNPEIPVVILDRSTLFKPGDEVPITEGFRLAFHNERYVQANTDTAVSKWNASGIYGFNFKPFTYRFIRGFPQASDYQVTISEVGADTSVSLRLSSRLVLPPKPVNFKVINISTGKDIDFAFWELDGSDGVFTAGRAESDVIIFMEKDPKDSLIATWSFSLIYKEGRRNPQAGDVATCMVRKPFLSNDVFEFVLRGPSVDKTLAKTELDDIKVVPNPYVVANSWEPKNPYASGRGPRQLHFIHLPPECTIKIFTIRGQLVDTIEHRSPVWDGTAIWDMLTKDNLDIAYGVYIYLVEAKGIGQKIGKFAVIK